MFEHSFSFHGAELQANPTGTLYWPSENLLCVSDLHLGRNTGNTKNGDDYLPAFELTDTLYRLENEINRFEPKTVICLGNSFDTLKSDDEFPEHGRIWLSRLMAGRKWIWIEGHNETGPVEIGGTHLKLLKKDGLVFQHLSDGTSGEITGYYNPKIRLKASGSRPCFAIDQDKVILPAFEANYGGNEITKDPLLSLLTPDAQMVLTGARAELLPLRMAS